MRVALCAAVLCACAAAGAALPWTAKRSLTSDLRALAAAKSERKSLEERLARLAQEERDSRDHLAIWNRLTELRIVGEERRLEWLDALARIRAARGLHDLRYQIEPQKPWKSEHAGAPVEIRSSAMKVELSLLHEGDLLRLLDDLRNSGNAYYAVRRCSIQRSAVLAGAAVAPSLHARCEIDLITMLERKEKT